MAEAYVREEDTADGTPIKYLPINRVYSSTAPFINPPGSKKIKARKLLATKDEAISDEEATREKKPMIVYSRRRKKEKEIAADEEVTPIEPKRAKYEPDADFSSKTYPTRLRTSGQLTEFGSEIRTGRRARQSKGSSALSKTKKWAELDFEGVDPNAFVGLECKVFWPMDDDFYKGSVTGYSSATGQHHNRRKIFACCDHQLGACILEDACSKLGNEFPMDGVGYVHHDRTYILFSGILVDQDEEFVVRKSKIEYTDGDVEKLVLRNEKIKFYISSEDVQRLNLKYVEEKGLNYNEMLALAASFNDCQELEPGEIIWAKITVLVKGRWRCYKSNMV